MADSGHLACLPCRCRVGLDYPGGRRELAWVHRLSAEEVTLHASQPAHVRGLVRAVVFVFSRESGQTLPITLRTRVRSCVFDGKHTDYRIALAVVGFEAGAESLLNEELARLDGRKRGRFQSTCAAEPSAPSYPLRRRIQLALGDGELRPAWTEQVSRVGMRFCSEDQFKRDTSLSFRLPVMLPDDPDIRAVQATARVTGVVLRSMGTFSTTLRFLTFEGDGQALLREELRQRFHDGERPAASAEPAIRQRPLAPIEPQRSSEPPASQSVFGGSPATSVEALPRLGPAGARTLEALSTPRQVKSAGAA